MLKSCFFESVVQRAFSPKLHIIIIIIIKTNSGIDSLNPPLVSLLSPFFSFSRSFSTFSGPQNHYSESEVGGREEGSKSGREEETEGERKEEIKEGSKDEKKDERVEEGGVGREEGEEG